MRIQREVKAQFESSHIVAKLTSGGEAGYALA
jgi:hypothetical protein